MDESRIPDNINSEVDQNFQTSEAAASPRAKNSKKKSRRAKPRAKRSLFMEYVHHWYIILISIMMCVPAYMMEIILGSVFIAAKVPAFVSALLTMFLGGLIATLPFLVLNIILVVRKKYFAIAVQLIAMMFLGMAFYLHYKIMM